MGAAHLLALATATIASFAMAVAAILLRCLEGVGVFNLQSWIALVSTIVLTLLSILLEAPATDTLPGIVLKNDALKIRILFGGLLTLLGVTIIALRNARKSTPTN